MDTFRELLLIALLIGINAFLSASEMAIVSVRRSRIQQLADEGNPAALTVQELLENPSAFLATVQIGVTFSGFFASAVSAVTLVRSLEGLLRNIPFFAPSAAAIALIAVTLLVTLVSLIFGELIPKRLAIAEAEKISLRVAGPIEWISRAAHPLIRFLSKITNIFLALLGSDQRVKLPSITENELRSLVESAADEGVMERSEQEMIDGIFDFGDTTVHEVMTPRIDIVGVEKSTPIEEAIPKFFSSGHGRLPIFEKNLDSVVGILFSQDVLQYLFEGGNKLSPVAVLGRATLFVPETKKASELLPELRESKVQLAITVDEYGGTAGLVTIEDLLEEIVGEIRSEYNILPESQIEFIGKEEARVSGRLGIEDLNQLFSLDIQFPGVDTVGGIIYAQLGRIPHNGEQVELPEAIFKVEEMAGKRIRKVIVRKKN
ncbi:MAG TPA: HlyC/CorC family transporter [Cyanobacteria bacterium UBA8530]|nr:HlyC/CorC family transporter [Cyanobacteria bacterium UBA8530]